MQRFSAQNFCFFGIADETASGFSGAGNQAGDIKKRVKSGSFNSLPAAMNLRIVTDASI
jgi:hypothetical protein